MRLSQARLEVGARFQLKTLMGGVLIFWSVLLFQGDAVRDPELDGAPVFAEPPLDRRRDHVEPQVFVQQVGGDLVLPALEVAAHLADGVLP